jgi:hypothetical protein
MKNLVLVALVLVVVVGLVSPAKADNSVVLGVCCTGRDYSNTIETTVHYAYTLRSGENQVAAYIAPDEVLIGGGAYITNGDSTAFLTGSLPLIGGSRGYGWVAQSKNRRDPTPHYLFAYAIGMRLYQPSTGLPIPAASVQPYVKYTMATSGYLQHPSATASAPTGYEVVAGGAMVWDYSEDGLPNNFLTSSYPVIQDTGAYEGWGTGWTASSKEHGFYSPAHITAYAISIPHNDHTDFSVLPYGDIRINYKYIGGDREFIERSLATSPSTPGRVDAGASVGGKTGQGMAGMRATGVGGKTTYGGWGRMLTCLYVGSTSVAACDSDDEGPDAGTLSAVSIGIHLDDTAN